MKMTQICRGEPCRAAKCAACCWNHPVARMDSFLRSGAASVLEALFPPAIAAPRRPRAPPSVLRPEVVFADESFRLKMRASADESFRLKRWLGAWVLLQEEDLICKNFRTR